MKKALKKVLLLCFTLALILSSVGLFAVPVSAQVYSGVCGANGNNLKWSFDSNTGVLTISGEGKMDDYSYYNFYYDDQLSPWRSFAADITSIVVEEGVTSVGSNAFADTRNVTSISIPDTIEAFSEYAFGDNNTWNPSYNTYQGGSYLGNEENPYLVLFGVNYQDTTPQIHPSTRVITSHAFYGCINITNISIPRNVINVCDDYPSAGYDYYERELSYYDELLPFGFDNLTGITVEAGNPVYHANGNCLIKTASKTLILGCQTSVIPSDGSVEHIGDYAFEYCPNLSSVTIPNGIKSIGKEAFCGCNLMSITVPKSVNRIASSAFEGNASSLESITVDSKNTNYHSYQNCLIETATKTLMLGCKNSIMPNDGRITTIASYAFYEVPFQSIHIPEGVQIILEDAFDWSNATSVSIPNSIIHLDGNIMENLSSETDMKLELNVYKNGTYLGNDQNPFVVLVGLLNPNVWTFEIHPLTKIIYADFSSCTNLTNLTIPNNVVDLYIDPVIIAKLEGIHKYQIGWYIGNEENPYHVFLGYEDSGIEPLEIHPDTKIIYHGALDGKPSSLIMHNNLVMIGDECLDGYGYHISFNGTEEEWNSIFKYDELYNDRGNYSITFTSDNNQDSESNQNNNNNSSNNNNTNGGTNDTNGNNPFTGGNFENNASGDGAGGSSGSSGSSGKSSDGCSSFTLGAGELVLILTALTAAVLGKKKLFSI